MEIPNYKQITQQIVEAVLQLTISYITVYSATMYHTFIIVLYLDSF